MGGACSTHGGEKRCTQGFRVLMRKPEGKDHLEDQGVDGRIILPWISRWWDGGMDWIDLAQNWERWRTLLRAVNEPSGSLICWEFLDLLRTV
jgi:hypothetical protein